MLTKNPLNLLALSLFISKASFERALGFKVSNMVVFRNCKRSLSSADLVLRAAAVPICAKNYKT